MYSGGVGKWKCALFVYAFGDCDVFFQSVGWVSSDLWNIFSVLVMKKNYPVTVGIISPATIKASSWTKTGNYPVL